MRTRFPQPELPFRQLGDPLYSQRNPHQIFLLVLSVIAAVGLIEGVTGSQILDDALSDPAVSAWGAFLLIGSVTGLIGMWWKRTWTGLVVERSGLFTVATAATIYSVLVIRAAPEAAYTAFVGWFDWHGESWLVAACWRVKSCNRVDAESLAASRAAGVWGYRFFEVVSKAEGA